MSKNSAYPLWLTLGLFGSLALIYFLVPGVQEEINYGFQLAKAGKREALGNWFQSFGVWGPLGIVVFMTLQMFLVVFPSWLPMIVANIGYGAFWGIVISIVAVIVVSTVGYFLGRSFGEYIIDNWISEKKEQKLERLVKRYGFGLVVLFRLSPLLSTDGISIVAGILRMSYWRYMLATLIGITPLAIAIGYFAQDWEYLKRGLYWLGGAGIVLYGIYIWLDWQQRRRYKKLEADNEETDNQ